MASLKHIHIYVRRDRNTYKCADPHCTHWTNKKDLRGKASICAVCEVNEIVLRHEELRRAKPRCSACSRIVEPANACEVDMASIAGKRLTIGSSLQLWFENGKAKHSRALADTPGVVAEVCEWQRFVETWVATVEQPSPTTRTRDEDVFRKRIGQLRDVLRACDVDNSQIRHLLVPVLRQIENAWPKLHRQQIESAIDDFLPTP